MDTPPMTRIEKAAPLIELARRMEESDDEWWLQWLDDRGWADVEACEKDMDEFIAELEQLWQNHYEVRQTVLDALRLGPE